MPVKARGKVRREKIAEDEQALAEFEKEANKVVVRREPRERQTISSNEIVLCIRDTFDRLYTEFDPGVGEQERMANADENARQVLRVIKHGIPNPGHGARITEQEQAIPLCADCK